MSTSFIPMKETDTMKHFKRMQAKAKTNPLKGKERGDCNVTQCQKSGAMSFNTATQAYYCEKCATAINESSERHGDPIYCNVVPDRVLTVDDESAEAVLKRIREECGLPELMQDVKQIIKLQRPKRNDRCPCGSGKKYKKCHMDEYAQMDRDAQNEN